MNQDLSIIELVLHASIVVKIVIAGLLLMSLFSWGLIFSKLGSLGKIKRRNEAFEQDFWSGKSLTDLYSQASNQAETGPLERLFSAIPAVVAYNRFARDIDRIAIGLESFSDEFSNILQRNAAAPQGVSAAR